MVSPINSLTNMEYMLYGGASGVNPNCPSFSNGYMANRNSWNYQMPYGYNNQSVWNNQFAQQGYGNSNVAGNDIFSSNEQATNQTGFGASSKDLDTIGKYYLKGMEPSESVFGAAGGGAAFALVNNTRFIAHPFNSLSTIGKVEKMFADVKKDGTTLNKLWNNPDSRNLMRDAYHKMHKLEGASKSRIGLFKSRLDENTYKALKKEMELVLKSGNKVQIAKVTEKIRIATGAQTGLISKAWNKVTGKKAKTIAERIPANSELTKIATKKVAESGSKTLSQQISHGFKSQGLKGGAFFAAIEYLMDFGKIRTAFSKDSKTGAKQLGQTTVKAAGSIVGWTVGEAAGAWVGAKAGAAIGTAVCPGLGTAIGAVAGLVGGSIGTWAMGKFTKWLVGEDVGSKVEVENMKKTAQGRLQLLELTKQQALDDKKLDPKVKLALQNVTNSYSAIA